MITCWETQLRILNSDFTRLQKILFGGIGCENEYAAGASAERECGREKGVLCKLCGGCGGFDGWFFKTGWVRCDICRLIKVAVGNQQRDLIEHPKVLVMAFNGPGGFLSPQEHRIL